jgi:hypothetical protein
VALIPTRAIPSGLGVRGQRELVGAVIPGTLVLIEIWLLVLSPQHAHRRGGYLKLASRGTELLRDFEREHGRAPVARALAGTTRCDMPCTPTCTTRSSRREALAAPEPATARSREPQDRDQLPDRHRGAAPDRGVRLLAPGRLDRVRRSRSPCRSSLAWVLGRRAVSRSQAESLDVMRHFLFAQWYAEGGRC